jgi:hypothetical protein
MRATRFQQRVLNQPLATLPRVNLFAVLDHTMCEDDYETLTQRQRANLAQYLIEFRELAAQDPQRPKVAVIDVARDPLREVDSELSVEQVRTLRTNSKHLWILPVLEVAVTFGHRIRLISRSEKCRLAGILPESLQGLDERGLEIAIGNTIPVALIGVVMWPLYRAWLHMETK